MSRKFWGEHGQVLAHDEKRVSRKKRAALQSWGDETTKIVEIRSGAIIGLCDDLGMYIIEANTAQGLWRGLGAGEIVSQDAQSEQLLHPLAGSGYAFTLTPIPISWSPVTSIESENQPTSVHIWKQIR